jgi:hypothetical protein
MAYGSSDTSGWHLGLLPSFPFVTSLDSPQDRLSPAPMEQLSPSSHLAVLMTSWYPLLPLWVHVIFSSLALALCFGGSIEKKGLSI